MATEYSNIDPANPPKPETKKIWTTFGILVGITAVEFAFAFTMSKGTMLIAIFVALTIVKAFFIVAQFMHLKYETKPLIYSILIIPLTLMVWLVVSMMNEANYTYDARSDFMEVNLEKAEGKPVE